MMDRQLGEAMMVWNEPTEKRLMQDLKDSKPPRQFSSSELDVTFLIAFLVSAVVAAFVAPSLGYWQFVGACVAYIVVYCTLMLRTRKAPYGVDAVALLAASGVLLGLIAVTSAVWFLQSLSR